MKTSSHFEYASITKWNIQSRKGAAYSTLNPLPGHHMQLLAHYAYVSLMGCFKHFRAQRGRSYNPGGPRDAPMTQIVSQVDRSTPTVFLGSRPPCTIVFFSTSLLIVFFVLMPGKFSFSVRGENFSRILGYGVFLWLTWQWWEFNSISMLCCSFVPYHVVLGA